MLATLTQSSSALAARCMFALVRGRGERERERERGRDSTLFLIIRDP
jgi:hypothetical protein